MEEPHPFLNLEVWKIFSYKSIRRNPDAIANLKLSAAVIQERALESRLHPILLREGGAPSLARLNSEGYGVHFLVEGETNLDARVFPKVTYSISHEGSTVTELDLTKILAEGIKKFADSNFGEDQEDQSSKPFVPWLPESQQNPMQNDISLIAAKILIPCIGCKRLLIDSTPERLRIVRDEVEELNFPEKLTEERMKILKKYEFFIKLSDPRKANFGSNGYAGLKPERTCQLLFSHEAYTTTRKTRRILGWVESVIESWSAESDSQTEKPLAYREAAEKLLDMGDRLRDLIGQKRTLIPRGTVSELVALMIVLFEPKQVFFYLGLTDKSLLDGLVDKLVTRLVPKLTSAAGLDLLRANLPDVQNANVAQQKPHFKFKIFHDAGILEFWRASGSCHYQVELPPFSTFSTSAGKYYVFEINGLLYFGIGSECLSREPQMGNIETPSESTRPRSRDVVLFMLNLELLATKLTTYIRTPAVGKLTAFLLENAEQAVDLTGRLRLPELHELHELDELHEPPEPPEPGEYGHIFSSKFDPKQFVSPHGNVWWYTQKGGSGYLTSWHPDNICWFHKQADFQHIWGKNGSFRKQTARMGFCSKGRFALFGIFGYRDDLEDIYYGQRYWGYWLFCYEIRKDRCPLVTMHCGQDLATDRIVKGTNFSQHVTWITLGKRVFCVLGLQSGRLEILLFKEDRFVQILKEKLRHFSRQYILVGEMTARTRIPISQGNNRTHQTLRISLNFN